jgi:hypothetical protein
LTKEYDNDTWGEFNAFSRSSYVEKICHLLKLLVGKIFALK